jgi:hypothetical protein
MNVADWTDWVTWMREWVARTPGAEWLLPATSGGGHLATVNGRVVARAQELGHVAAQLQQLERHAQATGEGKAR